MLNYIKEQPLARPSVTFKSIKDKPSGIRQSRLSRELDDILLTALRFEPERRYASAEQLGRDLKNYLDNEPVMARADSRKYRFQKFVQRNRTAVALVSLIIFILSGAVGAVLWQSQQTRIEAERATAVTHFIINLFETSDPAISGRPDITVSEVLEQNTERIYLELYNQPDVAMSMNNLGLTLRHQNRYEEAEEQLMQLYRLLSEQDEIHPQKSDVIEMLVIFYDEQNNSARKEYFNNKLSGYPDS